MEITAWHDQEVNLVPQYPKIKNLFSKISNHFHQIVVHPRPYRIVRFALTVLLIYGGMITLCDSLEPGHHRGGCALSLPIPAGPGISRKSIKGDIQ